MGGGVNRRKFLRLGALAGARATALGTAAGLSGCAAPGGGLFGGEDTEHAASGDAATAASAGHGHQDGFQHGVASGDPLADRVILWTRVTPPISQNGAALSVRWWIGPDPAGLRPAASGAISARADRDYTVKVDATGLEPGTDYYYGFECGDPRSAGGRYRSRIGRTRTAAAGPLDRLRFAVASCANYPEGYFNAYAAIAARDDLDFVLHLGDYLYEYGNGPYGDGTALDRIPEPMHETVRLGDYRKRHATYKRDPDLQAAHARFPWITIWDDHEIANNAHAAGAQNHQPEKGEGDYAQRRLAAVRAYYEWMPIRELPTGLFRRFRFGSLADLIVLDSRLAGRDPQVGRMDHAGANDPNRSMLGADQEEALRGALSEAQSEGQRWKLIGQQSPFSPLTDGTGSFNADSWDGYRASRRRLLSHLANASIDGTVILSGDYHSAWGFEVSGAPAGVDSPLAVEFVVPAVSSRPSGSNERARARYEKSLDRHPHLKYLDVTHNGYLCAEVDARRVRADWIFTGDAKVRSARTECGASFESLHGTNRLVQRAEAECGR